LSSILEEIRDFPLFRESFMARSADHCLEEENLCCYPWTMIRELATFPQEFHVILVDDPSRQSRKDFRNFAQDVE
ncbi:hypothetical protein HAX54_048711, partial [Datura stramonium]|nr:hypothetical protein [Datura stramonium]